MNHKHYNRKRHIKNLQDDKFYLNLIMLRNRIGAACDDYFQKLGAPKIDLYMICKGVSSPMGRGSDSIPIPITFGENRAYLVDSAQFGMEPLVQKKFDMVYCYLPSFRGEDPDDRHLNQFYHCEGEMRGDYKKCMRVVEGLVKHLIKSAISGDKKGEFYFEDSCFNAVRGIIKREFPVITFDEACALLKNNNFSDLVETRSYGRVLSKEGELKIAELVSGNKTPVWVTKYDRDTVPFYQLPDSKNPERVLNADLIFPSINGGFGGEIVGSGQRQKTPREIVSSMDRQGIEQREGYEWYINFRKTPGYKSTSGFGLGIERFVAWILGLSSIIDAAVYPVIKGEEFK